jgi:hypothetical protein
MVTKKESEDKVAKKQDPYLRYRDMGPIEVKEYLLNCAYTICIWIQNAPIEAKEWEELIYLTPYARNIAGMAGMILIHIIDKKESHESKGTVVSMYPRLPALPASKTPIEVGLIDAEIIMKDMVAAFAFNKSSVIVDDTSVKEYDTLAEMLTTIITFCKLVSEGGDTDSIGEDYDEQ